MARFLLLLLGLVVLAFVTHWVVGQPGTIQFSWLGYEGRIDMRALVGVAAFALLTYTFVMFVLRWLVTRPRTLRESWRARQSRRGYRALTQGMVAIAAGDPDEARKWSKRAEDLLDNPPLTLLLAAQSAQLNGDEQAARRYFEVMLEQDETRFLGLRGLVQIALKRGDEETALDYVKDAYSLRPDTPWVLDALFDLAERRGRLEEAVRALNETRRRKVLPRDQVDRRAAVLLYEEAKAAKLAGESALAVEKAKQAVKLAPDFSPAVVLLSDSLVASSRQRDAERALRKAWAVAPHPDLYRAWKRTRPTAEAPLAAKKALVRLVSGQDEHVESRLALAEAALETGDWAEARNELQAAEDKAADARVAELLARLAQAEHGDAAAARSWLETAAGRPAAPSWSCGMCRHEAQDWSPRCPACGAFDSLVWQTGRPLPDSGLALSPAQPDPEAEAQSPFAPVIATEAKGGVDKRSATPAESETAESTPPESPSPQPAPPPAAEKPPESPVPVAGALDKALPDPADPATPEERARRGL
ncbi:MAG: heme biosynthesis protein HemY [Rhodospirillales bacterium]